MLNTACGSRACPRIQTENRTKEGMHGISGIAIRSDLSRGLWEREESDSKAEKLTIAFPLMTSRGSMRNDGNAYIPFMAFALSQRPDAHALDVDGAVECRVAAHLIAKKRHLCQTASMVI